MPEDPFASLKPMLDGVAPITAAERRRRIEKAQRLMVESGLDAVFLEAGSGLRYFTGVEWGRSQRLTGAVIPRQGDPAYVCPAFEEGRLREQLSIGGDVRVWEEDESSYARVAGILADRGVTGAVGIEESVRFFLFDGLRRAAPHLAFASADPVTIPCRAYKSAAEIALIQRAMDITAEAYKACLPLLREGIMPAEMTRYSVAAHRALSVEGAISFQFGVASTFPHGTREPSPLRRGDVVLTDGGCTVDGYHSDISRVLVFGEPTARQRAVWELEKRAQAAAFAAARVGVPCEDVDAAARGVIVAAGFGPGYKLPGLPHRTGHGLGLDIHEWHHLAPGNRVPLAPGMCFSDEPMIVIPGEFGMRIEDCFYVTEEGPRFFTTPSPSIERPFA